MTDYEKNLIARIQLSQLASDETYEDDFYYRMRNWRQKKDKPKATTAPASGGDVLSVLFGNSAQSENQGEGSEDKFQKLLAEAKAHVRPKATQRKFVDDVVVNKLNISLD